MKSQNLSNELKDTKESKKRIVLKKILANMTMGNNDLSMLFGQVLDCGKSPYEDIRKMVFYYIVVYARLRVDQAEFILELFKKDIFSDNPRMRGCALRNIASIQLEPVNAFVKGYLKIAMSDKDPYVSKTAAVMFLKLYFHTLDQVDMQDYNALESLLDQNNAAVNLFRHSYTRWYRILQQC